DAVKKAVDEAEVMAGLQIESVYVGIAGDHIRSVNSRGVISVMGKHKEIAREDIDRVIEASKSINVPAELELLHVIPREFVLDGNVVHTNVLPVGAGHFTSDISVVLRTPMEDAERIKKRYGCALGSLVTEDDPIEVPTVGGRAPKILSKHELTNIIEPRAAEI